MHFSNLPIEIFYSYIETDARSVRSIRQHISVFVKLQENANVVERSRDELRERGQNDVTKYLNTAHIILLFVSPKYLDSDDYLKESKLAMEQRYIRDVIVIPILLRPIADRTLNRAPFAKLTIYPLTGEAISQLKDKKESMCAKIADDIIKTILTLMERTLNQKSVKIENTSIPSIILPSVPYSERHHSSLEKGDTGHSVSSLFQKKQSLLELEIKIHQMERDLHQMHKERLEIVKEMQFDVNSSQIKEHPNAIEEHQ